ncbi:malto-oligosyltrehalose trehalohydrolase [Trueperella sp. LYQ141]|uniref:malto-oligosyltrehalose trehalohydrolase n=1 Tax=Trueperella sp. LYQ141 TaxID=3391058 RepID=UPI003982F45B
MKALRIWAPHAHEVTVELCDTGQHRALHSCGAGVFELAEGLPHGQQYYVHLDGGMPLPDPRSMCQPYGAHGPSQAVDPDTFQWTDAHWHGRDLHGAIYYELHVGAFTPEGTLRAAINRLDYLRDLGVDVVQLMPIPPMPGKRGWGYDGVSIFAIHHPYGAPEDLVAFVNAAHERQLSVCLDVVYNHLGPDGNYLAQFGPYFTDAHHTPWGLAVNLDGHNSEEVRRYFLDNARQWVRDYHIDSLRIDAAHYLIDSSEPHFLAQLSQEMNELSVELDRRITLTAETEANDPAMITPTTQGGLGMDLQWTDDIHHALHVWLTGEHNAYYQDYVDPQAMRAAFENGFVRIGQELAFPSASRGRPIPAEISGHCFMAFDENHDQVGNRLLCDRPTQRLALGQVAVSRALILLSHYTPMLFMGEEWATKRPFHYFTDHGPELGAGIKDGRMAEFAQWDLADVYPDISLTDVPLATADPQDEQTFISSLLDWSELELTDHRRMYDFVRDLIRLRASVADIASGDRSRTRCVFVEPPAHEGDTEPKPRYGAPPSGWMERGSVVIVFSLTGHTDITPPIAGKELLLAWDESAMHISHNTLGDPQVSMSAPNVAIWG